MFYPKQRDEITKHKNADDNETSSPCYLFLVKWLNYPTVKNGDLEC